MSGEPVSAAVALPRPASGPAAQRRAIAINSGIVLLSIATGGLSADILQLYAVQVLGLSPRELGIALGSLVVTIPIQLAAARLTWRYSARRIMQVGYGAILVLLVPLGALAELRSSAPEAVFPLFLATILLIELAISCSWAVVWFAWMRDITEPGERGVFLGRMRLVTQSTAGIALLVLTVFVGSRMAAEDYQLLLLGLGIYLFCAIVALRKLPSQQPMHEPEGPDAEHAQHGIFRAYLAIARQATLAVPILLTGLTAFLCVPLAATYAVIVLGYPATLITLATCLSYAAVLASVTALGRRCDRRGARRLAAECLAGLAAALACWIFTRPAGTDGVTIAMSSLYIALSVVTFVAASGLTLATNVWISNAASEVSAVPAFTAMDVISSASIQLSLAVSGVVIAWAQASTFVRGDWTFLDPFKLFLLLGAVAAALAAVLLPRWFGDETVHDPDEGSESAWSSA